MLAARHLRRCRPALAGHAGALTALAIALVVFGPILTQRGYLLHYDAVFVPRLPFNAAVLGVDGNAPRAVPNDLVVAVLSRILPGDVVEKVLLVGAFVFSGVGVDRWRQPVSVAVVACVCLLWNPWVAERLSIGHISYVWGYAALVWIVVGALRWRGEHPDGLASLVVGLCVSALAGSTPGLMAAVAALVLALAPGPHRPRLRPLLGLLALWVGLNAAWWWPAWNQRPGEPADPDGVRAFAATADSSGGLVASVLGGGGIWHQPSWFAERASGPLPFVAAALLVGGVLALVHTQRQRIGLAVMGALGLLVACAASIPGISDGVVWALVHVPGGGLLRDGQKFLAWWVVPACLGVGVGAHAAARRAQGSWLAPMAVVVATVLPVALLPSFAGARSGRWQAVEYPREFAEVSALMNVRGGRVVSMPWRLYRRHDWNHGQVVLDPIPRLLAGDVLVNDTLTTNRYEVTGERPETLEITQALDSPDKLSARLRALRVTFIVIDKTQPGAGAAALRIGTVVHDGRRLVVRQLSASGHGDAPTRAWPWGLTITAATVLVGLLRLGARRGRVGTTLLRSDDDQHGNGR